MKKIENTNISSFQEVITPKKLKEMFPVTEDEVSIILKNRETIQNILNGTDKRIFAVVGPCSIHNYEQAMTYAHELKRISEEVKDTIFLIMRVYFEKPRTTIGWKGLINDPDLDGTFQLEKGMKTARKLMLNIIKETGLPIGTEALDPISPQYLNDLVSWNAIGARTTESQTHREMASGLSSPVGFKNGTDGDCSIAINAMLSSCAPHSFFGVNELGEVSIVNTSGNKYGHIILRGGENGPNYSSQHIQEVESALEKANLPLNIVIDCSHANSNKNYKYQSVALFDIVEQIKNGSNSLKGFMLESNINEGTQKLILGEKDNLKYGVSITDGCINLQETHNLLIHTNSQLSTTKIYDNSISPDTIQSYNESNIQKSS